MLRNLLKSAEKKPTYLHDENGKEICLDIISELCHSEIDGSVMSTEEITSFIALVVGEGETTRGAILNLWYLLLQHPDQYRQVKRMKNYGTRHFMKCFGIQLP